METQKHSKKQRYFLPIYCLAVSFLFLMICSKSSFLYTMNDWPDVNIYYTLGRGIAEGQVPYRDLFEQKGPLLFFIYALAYLLSPTNYLGTFFLEVLSFAILLLYIYKISRLYLGTKSSAFLLPVFSMLLVTSDCFYYGGSAEEFVLPMLAAGLYHLLKYFKNDANIPVSYKVIFINGVFAGCVLWIKYTMLGFWFAWMASLFFIMLSRRQIARALYSCAAFLGGMLLASLPILLYFLANNALGELFHTYFYVNLFSYTEHTSFLHRLLMLLYLPAWHIGQDIFMSFFLVFGLLSFTIQSCYLPKNYMHLSLLSCLLFLDLSVFFRGTTYIYYFFIFTPFTILGLISAFHFFRAKFCQKKISPFISVMIMIVFSICFGGTWLLSPNTRAIGIDKQDYAQFRFAEIIRREPDATLLCCNMMDDGFYYIADISPTEKFFCRFNLPEENFPEQYEQHRQAIKEKRTTYLILKSRTALKDGEFPKDHAWISENYEYIDRATQFHERSDVTYLLYRART